MPYQDGVRISQERYMELHSEGLTVLHTGPNGENPAPSGPPIDPATGVPKSEGRKRGKRTNKATKAAIADAMGVNAKDKQLDAIDVSGLDA